jgi:signal transduction protein with GAF and PtsI domain
MDEKTALVLVTLGHLTVERDRAAYLERVVELCSQATDAQRCTVYVVDHEEAMLRSAVAQRLGQEIRLPIGKGLAGHVAATGETINVPDAYDDPRFDPSVDRRSGFRTTNILSVPVWDRDGRSVVGVIQVLNKRGGAFERHDQMLLERIAEAIGPVLEQPAHRRGGVR